MKLDTDRLGPRPTLRAFTVAARETGMPRSLFADLTVADVIAAARARAVPIRDGRIDAEGEGLRWATGSIALEISALNAGVPR